MVPRGAGVVGARPVFRRPASTNASIGVLTHSAWASFGMGGLTGALHDHQTWAAAVSTVPPDQGAPPSIHCFWRAKTAGGSFPPDSICGACSPETRRNNRLLADEPGTIATPL